MSDKPEQIISDDEIIIVHGGANFGDTPKRDVVNYGVLKCACGYYQGYTSRQINVEHGLIDKDYKLTQKGREYLWSVFGKDCV